jgi:hypothetical protein
MPATIAYVDSNCSVMRNAPDGTGKCAFQADLRKRKERFPERLLCPYITSLVAQHPITRINALYRVKASAKISVFSSRLNINMSPQFLTLTRSLFHNSGAPTENALPPMDRHLTLGIFNWIDEAERRERAALRS